MRFVFLIFLPFFVVVLHQRQPVVKHRCTAARVTPFIPLQFYLALLLPFLFCLI